VLAALLPARAYAEWQFTPFLGFTFKGNTNLFDPAAAIGERHWNFGGTVRWVGGGILGVESIFLYVPGLFERDRSPVFEETPEVIGITGSRSVALMGNIVLTTPRSWNRYGLRPFVSGGLGLLHAMHNDLRLPMRESLRAFNAGGGAVGLLTDRVGVRFDLRYFSNHRPGGEPLGGRPRLHYWTSGLGVVFKY
jgi:hypothetical protein